MGEGSETFGKYQLVRRLAFGGMAEIFLARLQGEQGFAKKVVLKRILPQFGTDENFVRMFTDEAVIAARLTHPNVVQVYDFGDVDGVYFIAMEWVDGIDLSQVLKQLRRNESSLSPAQVAAVGEGICRGLGYAHNFADDDGRPLHIVHRDISPHNIMLSRSGEAKVMDFGIAKAEERATRTKTGMIKGKIAYMAPEQVQGFALDKRTDQFAVGLVLWECLTGQRTFSGDTDFEILRVVTDCKVEPPSRLRADVPPELDRIIMRALSRAADDRYPDLADLEHDLSAFRFSLGPNGAVQLGKLVDELAPRRPSGAVRRTLDLASPTPSPAAEGTAVVGTLVPGPGARSGVTQPEAPPEEDDTGGAWAGDWPDEHGATEATFAGPSSAELATRESARTEARTPASTGAGSGPSGRVAADQTFPERASVTPGKGRRVWWMAGAGVALAAAIAAAWLLIPGLRGGPTEGTLIVLSEPPGADVRIQGASVGLMTPAPIPHQPLGQPLQVEVRRKGYVTARKVVTLSQARQEITLVLQQEETPPVGGNGNDAADPEPPKPDNTPKPKPPPDDTPGPKPPKPNPKPKHKTKPVVEDAPAAKATGLLSLRVREGWAAVYIGQRSLGSTPLTDVVVPAGKVKLRLVNPETGAKKEITLEVKPDAKNKHTVEFP